MDQPSATLTIVGSGTLVPSPDRRSPGHLLQTSRHTVLLDCGPGTMHGLAAFGLPWERLTHVGITHFHNDHIGDLPALMTALRQGRSAPRTLPLTLFGPVGLRALLRRMSAATGSSWLEQDVPVVFEELGDGSVLSLDGPARAERVTPGSVGSGPPELVRAVSTPHTEESVAYRVSGPWGSVGYTGDTGPSTELGRAMGGVDVLVAECTHAEEVEGDTHLSPKTVAELAQAAGPGLLVLTHVFPPTDPARVAARVEQSWGGPVEAAFDGLRIRVESKVVTVDPPEGDV